MEMKQYLIDSFRYNDHANKLALRKMRELAAPEECVKFFSHLINSMNKWLGRIQKWGEDVAIPSSVGLPDDHVSSYKELEWWLPVYEMDELELKWDECLDRWMEFLE